eukprot:jgi/Orpsp1_1/1180171/evm.model.c7180000072382.1
MFKKFYIITIIYYLFILYTIAFPQNETNKANEEALKADEIKNDNIIQILVRQPDMPFIMQAEQWEIEYENLINNFLKVKNTNDPRMKDIQISFNFYEYYPINEDHTSEYLNYFKFTIDDWINSNYDMMILDDRILFNDKALIETDSVEYYLKSRTPTKDHLLDLTSYIDKSSLSFNDQKMLKDAYLDGKLYGLPYEMDYDLIYYYNSSINMGHEAFKELVSQYSWKDLLKFNSYDESFVPAFGDEDDFLNFFLEYTSNSYELSKEIDSNFYSIFYNKTADSLFNLYKEYVYTVSENNLSNVLNISQDDVCFAFLNKEVQFFKGKASHHSIVNSVDLNILNTLNQNLQRRSEGNILFNNQGNTSISKQNESNQSKNQNKTNSSKNQNNKATKTKTTTKTNNQNNKATNNQNNKATKTITNNQNKTIKTDNQSKITHSNNQNITIQSNNENNTTQSTNNTDSIQSTNKNNDTVLFTLPPKYYSTVNEKYLVVNKHSKKDPKILIEIAKLMTSKEMQLLRAKHFGTIPTFDLNQKESDQDIQSYCQNEPEICENIQTMKRIYIKDIFTSEYSPSFFETRLLLPSLLKKYLSNISDLDTIKLNFRNIKYLVTSEMDVNNIVLPIALGGLTLGSLIIVYLVHKHRNHPYIKVISPKFCNIIIFGFILSINSPLFVLPPYSILIAKISFIYDAFNVSLIVLPMIAITYRIYRIYNSKMIAVESLHDKRLSIYIIIVLSIYILYKLIIVFTCDFYYLSFGYIDKSRYPVFYYDHYTIDLYIDYFFAISF